MTLEFRRLGYEVFTTRVTNCAAQVLAGLTPGTHNLNAVSVVATRDAPSIRQPVSVATLSRPELTRSTGLFLDDALNVVPGVRMERRTMSGGQRITIRGYGNRTNFDGSGYKAYLNGIQDALAGVESARVVLARARQRLIEEEQQGRRRG